jgi:hypothetical protein
MKFKLLIAMVGLWLESGWACGQDVSRSDLDFEVLSAEDLAKDWTGRREQWAAGGATV